MKTFVFVSLLYDFTFLRSDFSAASGIHQGNQAPQLVVEPGSEVVLYLPHM